MLKKENFDFIENSLNRACVVLATKNVRKHKEVLQAINENIDEKKAILTIASDYKAQFLEECSNCETMNKNVEVLLH